MTTHHEPFMPHQQPFRNTMQLFETLSLREHITKVFHGLKQPADSGDYKWARLQMTRLWSPTAAVVVPALVLLIITILATLVPDKPSSHPVILRDEKPPPELEKPPELPKEMLSQWDDPSDVESVNWGEDAPNVEIDDTPVDTPNEAIPAPETFVCAIFIRSPVTFAGLYANRGPKAKARMAGRFGAPPGGEDAVIRALRWLKKHQKKDGSWDAGVGGGNGKPGIAPVAMTGYALLTYLAHGDIPSNSSEFGPTVERAIKWLLENQREDGWWNASGKDVCYGQPIAAYAICEAFGMTQRLEVGEAARRAIRTIIQRQNAHGGWNYFGKGGERCDMSVMGWAGQALKAALIAGVDEPGLKSAIKRATESGFAHNYNPSTGAFGYTGPANRHGLTGVGTVCMQLLGKADSPIVQKALEYLEADTFRWEGATWKQVYYWYYNTQAKFHAGEEIFKRWNNQFAKPLMNAQTIIEGAGDDSKDIGYWDTGNDRGGRVMDTCLSALMLQVYYRYLPTYQKLDDDDAALFADENNDEPKQIHIPDIDVEIIEGEPRRSPQA